jgi:signal transduction histidine kinase
MSKRISVQVSDGEETWVNIDPSKFSQALVNVLTNADRYSPSGPIEVRTEVVGGGTQARIATIVRDYGVGMDKHELARLFQRDRIVPAAGKAGGLGLGLGAMIVRGIIESMGGTVEAKSRPGRGTTILLWLPVAPAPVQQP